jgi:cellulose synthase (UDP-forming)
MDDDDDDEDYHRRKKSPMKVWGTYPDMNFEDESMPKDRVKIVARIKPVEHHNKAGNINNVLYNTEVREKGQYLIFLDNDMRPEPDFLLYTLPWFYNEGQLARHWEINDNLSFVQTPQIFVRDAIRDGDKLGNGNQVFFAAIQPGRDGENACAFAGTNAIFAKRALLRIGGVPYESQTEDAHTSIRLHRDGFVSYYVNLPLVVGEAPTTVASRLLQYLRWVKGSIQLWWAQYYQPPRKMCIGEAPPKLPRDQRPSKFMLTFYAIDTMTWPLSAISALLYMFCALVFVYCAEPPLEPHDPFDISSFLWVFLPYLCLRMANNLIALQGVKSSSVWVAQEVWYAQAFTAFLGILDALYEKFLGTGLTGWKVTGEGTRTTAIEYFNVVVALLLFFGVIIRLIVFLADDSDRLISFGSAFFASIILVQLWPMVSMSLYELLVNEYKPADEKKELGRFKIPNWLGFTAVLCVGISAGVLFA